jgi:hypothetical protein
MSIQQHAATGGYRMAKKSKLENRLTDAAVKIGSVAGKMDGTAHRTAEKATRAAKVAKKELVALGKQMDALTAQLKKSRERLQRALK